MPSTASSVRTPSHVSTDSIFNAAFAVPRDPRSAEYKAGVRAALVFRIEGRRIAKLYAAGTAQDDAYHAGIAEGNALWRAAAANAQEVAA